MMFRDRVNKDRDRPVSPSRVVGLLSLVCVLMIGLQIWREWVAYDVQLRETATALTNLATSLVRQADDTFEVADSTLAGVVQQLEADGLSRPALAHLDTMLQARAAGFPRFRDVTVIGRDGRWLASSLPAQAANLSYRAYFQHHRDDPAPGPFIGPPLRSALTGQWILTVSRRFRDANGQFAGVVLAVIDMSYFVRQYAAYDLGGSATITLLKTDGTMLARNPVDDLAIGADLSSGAVFRELRSHPIGSYRTRALTDGVHRVSAYSRSSVYPILAVTAVSDRNALGDWFADAVVHVAIVLGLIAIIGLLVLHLLRQTNRAYVAQVKSRESEAGFRLLAENASDMISRFGQDGTRLYVSPAVERIFGVSADWLASRNLLQLIHPLDVLAVSQFQDRLLKTQAGEDSIVFRAINPDRGEVWVEANARPLVDEITLAPDGFVSVVRDVTDRQRLEAERESHLLELKRANVELDRLARHFAKARDMAERASRAKTRFLAGMSHELRTPLNGILGYAQLLCLEGGLSPMQSMRVDAMLGAGRHLLQMVHCVLDLSEIENERVELRIEPVVLRHLGDACLDLVRPAAEEKGLSLSFVVAPDVPQQTMTDPARLRQILLNLLGNAVKFTQSGQVAMRLGLQGATTLRFEVADTGPGVPADQHYRLFQEFERLDVAAAGMIEGAGLGLSLAAGLATLMEGRLGHEDNPGGGSVFWLELPAVDASAAPAPVPALPDAAAPTARRGTVRPLRVLVVDDVAMNRDIAAAFIRSAGHEVTCAEGGDEAVAAVQASDFDIVMMDVRMPQVDGLEATRRIRALDGPRALVPIMAMTAQAFSEQVKECRAAGMTGHLAKPFTIDTLLGALTEGMSLGPADGPPADPPPPEADALPVIDRAELGRTAAMLTPEAVAAHLRTIADKARVLLVALRASNGSSPGLAQAAHALAGSAGMFGFARLAFVGCQFERAAMGESADIAGSAMELGAAIEATLMEIDRHQQLADA